MATLSTDAPTAAPAALRYAAVRGLTERLCAPLETEDFVVQSMPDVSPTKWHLAHTSWFFEMFVLKPYAPAYRELNPEYAFLFNSYYVQAGERHCRAQRGYISRPTVAQVFEYRRHVDAAMTELLDGANEDIQTGIAGLVDIGLNHEQQHQELLLTDIKHVLSVNPLRPVYAAARAPADTALTPLRWVGIDGGIRTIGHTGDGFAYDNESPQHDVLLQSFELADRLVTNGEYLAFMEDGGYRRPELWLSMGWATVQEQQWSEPFYWERRGDEWHTFALHGMQPVAHTEPVVHLSYFEADAFARWAGARLPTEAEWEVAARLHASPDDAAANFVESGVLHPRPADPGAGLRQMYGDVWEWTQSQYMPYPRYRPAAGAIGEYNGKFMCNQFVLRGGSCATSQTHIRPTYRNFFPPDATWQFSGVRLARDT